MKTSTIFLFIFTILLTIQGYSQENKTTEPVQWPKIIKTSNTQITVYQPQLESLDNTKLEARAAVSVKTKKTETPVFGAIWFDCRISTDFDERTVTLENLRITGIKFPEAKDEQIAKLKKLIEEKTIGWNPVMSLDQLLADLSQLQNVSNKSENLNNEAPEIIFSTKPAVLITIDGDPQWKDVPNASYQYVINTPFFIVQDTRTKTNYLKGGDFFYISKNVLSGWQYLQSPPSEVVKMAQEAMPEADNAENEKTDEGEKPSPAQIIVRTKPAELLQSSGEPDWASVNGASLLYMKNTDSDILMDINTQQYYILISGRWYKSKDIKTNDWTFISPDKVPEDFSNIPKDSEIASLRANVAGTQEAKDAVLENTIPQTAEVDRKTATVEVTYDGNPKFEKIPGTSISYAVNTDKSVLLINNKYYCVDNAIWFESVSATGPWSVCVDVPDEVQDIPPESPVYNVKYVYIYDYSPTVVYVGYTPGYVHSYIYHGCVVYGTGWYYRPWYGMYYYPRPVTYGFNVRWNPYTGWGFSFGMSFGGPAGWFAFGWHSPHYGWWGPGGYRYGYSHGYHRGYRNGYYRGYKAGQHNAARNNLYRNQITGVRKTGGKPYNPKTGRPANNTRPSTRPSTRPVSKDTRDAAARPSNRNNIYTDREGNVYKRDGDSWQKHNKDGWKDVPATRDHTRPSNNTRDIQRPAPNTREAPATRPATRPTNSNSQMGNLNKSYQSRQQGAQKTQHFQQNRSNTRQYAPRSGNSRAPGRGRRH